jgi:hypothetical protein
VALHGAIDRDAVPVLQDDTRLERRIEPRPDAVSRRTFGASAVPIISTRNGTRRDLVREGARARVPRVRVAHTRDDVGQLDVESVVGELIELTAEDAQALDRIEAVSRPFERQVRVDALESRARCRR